MDIAVQVMINPASHTLTGNKEVRRLKTGDIIQVINIDDVAAKDMQGNYEPSDVISSPRCGFLYVTDAPSGVVRDYALLLRAEAEESPDNVTVDFDQASKQDWIVDQRLLSAAQVNSLTTNKYAQMTWTDFRVACLSKSEARALVDNDIGR